jgi:predicted nucleic acid-binding protein
MSGYLLDTNVISEFARPDNKPDPQVKAWLEAADPDSLYVSVLTFGEIRSGIEARRGLAGAVNRIPYETHTIFLEFTFQFEAEFFHNSN